MPEPRFQADLRRSPFAGPAVAYTCGILLDRYGDWPIVAGWAVAFVACLLGYRTRQWGYAACGLLLGMGMVAHHAQRDTSAGDHILQRLAGERQLLRVRGWLADEPFSPALPPADALRSQPPQASTRLVAEVQQVQLAGGWMPCTGRVLVTVASAETAVHAGDAVELFGWVGPLPEPQNPGEFDARSRYLDQRIHAQMQVRGPGPVVLWEESAYASPMQWLARWRAAGQANLVRALPDSVGGLAGALLLGDGAPLERATWERYLRTGVIHVLAISGQHLVILAGFLQLVALAFGVPRRPTAIGTAIFLVGYALITGAHPPIVRSAVGGVLLCGAVLFRRRIVPINALSLAWLVVGIANPCDVADVGCQLSFLCVLGLAYAAPHFAPGPMEPLDRLQAQLDPWYWQLARYCGQVIADNYRVATVIGLLVMPLVAYRGHLIAPVGILIGPPVTLLTSIALLSGFGLLIASSLLPPAAGLFAGPTAWALQAADALVRWADGWPGSHCYLPDIPLGWLIGAYALLLACLWLPAGSRWPRWKWLAGLAWLALGFWLVVPNRATGELRVAFLAVGHGGCTVIELPDGGVLLYDVGSLAGPEVVARQVAPYLWSRGIVRIDEVLLSHADLDHFNGLPALLDRFAVGRIVHSPSFEFKESPSVRAVTADWQRRGIAPQLTRSGDVWRAGDVTIEVLHPPAEGPAGSENVRSLVLLLTHGSHRFLFTGDLEGVGQERVLRLPIAPVDVLMAPHHGSPAANPEALYRWAGAPIVVATTGPPRSDSPLPDRAGATGAQFYPTHAHGAIIFRSHPSGLTLETFTTRERRVLKPGK